jgi:chromosome segregation ATPase
MPTPTLEQLHARRDELNMQLTALQAQRVQIANDVRQVEADQRAIRAKGQDGALLMERRKQREIGLQQTSWAIEQLRQRLDDTDAEIRRRDPLKALERDIDELLGDLQTYDADRARLDGAHQAAINTMANIAQELHELVWTTRQRHDDLVVRARNLRAAAQRLGHPALAVPTPHSWSQPLERALRGTGAAWRAYLTSIHNRAPEPFARELGAAAAIALAARRQTRR